MLTKCAKLSALLLVNLMWAAQYPAYKIASEQMDLWTLNFWSLLIATVLLTPFLLAFRPRGLKRGASPPNTVWRYLMLGLLGIIPPSVFMSWGISHSSASNAAIISLTIPPVMVLFAAILLGERMTGLRWLSMAAALLGTILLSGVQTSGSLFNSRTLIR